MNNDILFQRICKLIAMNYAVPEYQVYNAFLKLNSLDKTLELTQSGKLTEIFEEIPNEESHS